MVVGAYSASDRPDEVGRSSTECLPGLSWCGHAGAGGQDRADVGRAPPPNAVARSRAATIAACPWAAVRVFRLGQAPGPGGCVRPRRHRR